MPLASLYQPVIWPDALMLRGVVKPMSWVGWIVV